MTIRIAMWSGPRNISTAMMRAWENRPDCTVVDEPFYAYYLAKTGIDHPLSPEVIASQSTDWHEVCTELCEVPCATEIYYQKHMTHHMLEEIGLDWTEKLKHCFLIRHPRYVVNSYIKKRESISIDDIGIKRQCELYKSITDITGQSIPVIEASQFLRGPEVMLKKICELFEIPFYREMLEWPPGRRETDGVWASHWYQNVENSTSFEPYREPVVSLEDEHIKLVEESEPYYQFLLDKRM